MPVDDLSMRYTHGFPRIVPTPPHTYTQAHTQRLLGQEIILSLNNDLIILIYSHTPNSKNHFSLFILGHLCHVICIHSSDKMCSTALVWSVISTLLRKSKYSWKKINIIVMHLPMRTSNDSKYLWFWLVLCSNPWHHPVLFTHLLKK